MLKTNAADFFRDRILKADSILQEDIFMNREPELLLTYYDNAPSLAQNAYLFSLSAHGSAVSCIGMRREACILSASLTELVFREVLLPAGGSGFFLTDQKPPEYLAALCKEMKPGFISLQNLLTDLLFGTVPSPSLTLLNQSLGESVCLLGLAGRRQSKKQVLFPPCRSAVEQLAAQLKHLLLNGAPLSPQLWILCYLLDATGLWNRFFSRRELALARKRIPKMNHTLAGRILGTIDRIDSALTMENFCAC